MMKLVKWIADITQPGGSVDAMTWLKFVNMVLIGVGVFVVIGLLYYFVVQYKNVNLGNKRGDFYNVNNVKKPPFLWPIIPFVIILLAAFVSSFYKGDVGDWMLGGVKLDVICIVIMYIVVFMVYFLNKPVHRGF